MLSLNNIGLSRKFVLLLILLAIVVYVQSNKANESYEPTGAAYRYGFVDTNPMRRTGQFFDTCSPENMEDCSRNNPYEGLPLP